MASLSLIVLESAALEVADATSHPVAPPLRDRADPRPASLPLGEHRARGLGGMLALIGVVAVVAVAGMVVAVARMIVLLALALTGTFLLPAILLVAFVVVVLLTTGAAG